MSKNCIKCGVNDRTGLDLLCDDCRSSRNADIAYFTDPSEPIAEDITYVLYDAITRGHRAQADRVKGYISFLRDRKQEQPMSEELWEISSSRSTHICGERSGHIAVFEAGNASMVPVAEANALLAVYGRNAMVSAAARLNVDPVELARAVDVAELIQAATAARNILEMLAEPDKAATTSVPDAWAKSLVTARWLRAILAKLPTPTTTGGK
jgi:hypothetical protein